MTYTLASELSADSFSSLKDAEVQDVCSTSRALIAKQTPDPFSRPLSVHPIVDGAALAAVKQWTFEPKLCDGKSVSTVTRLDVHFHH